MKNKHSDPYLIQNESNIFGSVLYPILYFQDFATHLYKFEKFHGDKLPFIQYSPSYHFKELIKAWIFFPILSLSNEILCPSFFVILSREKRWHIKSVK